MAEAQSEAGPRPTLDGARVWLVTDGTADAQGWQETFVQGLRRLGAGSVDVLGVSGVIGLTARGLLGTGAEKIARTLRLGRRGEPDAPALDALERGKPDLVIADHPGILRVLDVIRETTGLGSLHVALVGAFVDHEQWIGTRADAYVIPDAALLERLRRPGLPEVGLAKAGPPVPPGFGRDLDRPALRAEFGFDEGRAVLLVDATTMPPEVLDRVVFHASVVQGEVTPLFYYGNNGEAADTLRHLAQVHGLTANMFGAVAAYEEYAVVADLILVGPGNPLVGAYLRLDRPLVAIDPTLAAIGPAHDGAVVVLSDTTALGEVLTRVASGGVAESHRAAAEAAVSPYPTVEACAAIAAIWAARAEIRHERLPIVEPPQANAPGDAAPATPVGRSARFEAIGGSGASAEMQPLSRAAAKEQLAALIMDERRIEADIAAWSRDRDKWFERLALAESYDDDELAGVAKGRLEDFKAKIEQLNDRLDAIHQQKDLVRRRVAAGKRSAPGPDVPAPDAYEERFRKLEMNRDLDRLRQRAEDDES